MVVLVNKCDVEAGFMMRTIFVIAIAAVMFAGGCGSGVDQSLFDQVKVLQGEKTELRLDVERLEKENTELKKQIGTLISIDREVRLEVLERVSGIEIARRTGLFDKDKDGTKESLIVYVRTIDNSGDAIKAAGSVELQLWDLGADDNARLAVWETGPEELKELWASTIMTNYFRLTNDVSELLKDVAAEELTVKVTFTDYVTGKVFRKQTVIKR